ncbi:MAG: U32 family peptidase [Bacteroidales bacterium]|nr:U32 family peptidase [Bacteroidales bacterium]
MPKKIELLSPAKNLECGLAAINCGADAVYIGASAFGARAAAGNSLNDIEKLVNYAHLFRSKVFVTINTLLKDCELELAQQLIEHLYEIGVDALITQDMGLLKLDLPPIALHASTQTDNRTVEKVKFLESVGFQRAVLARELSLPQIAEIRKATTVELEAFVHGALCVSYSGQCYMSELACGRSANRGVCAQFCRLPYSLVDSTGKTIEKDRHLLSLKDMDRSDFLLDMMNAGVTSLKIEGRLKEADYVKNITSFYRKKLDAIFAENQDFTNASYGTTTFSFEPNPAKTFHRGKTDYFLNGHRTLMSQPATPKSVGEYIGKVKQVVDRKILIDSSIRLNNGDGLCFVDPMGHFAGFRANRVEENAVFMTETLPGLVAGVDLYRNSDVAFQKLISQNCSDRRLDLYVVFAETESGFSVTLTDETQDSVIYDIKTEKMTAQKAGMMQNLIKTQFSKLGTTIFRLASLEIHSSDYFIPSSLMTEWRRKAVQKLMDKKKSFKTESVKRVDEHIPFGQSLLNFKSNVLNHKAKEFYLEHGVERIESDFLAGNEEVEVMRCKFCLRNELGACKKQSGSVSLNEPLFLVSQNQRFRLSFDCSKCEMSIFT